MCREEVLTDASESSEEEAEGSQQHHWAAQAESCLSSRGSPPIWADSQFHILEMQSGVDSRSPQQWVLCTVDCLLAYKY